MSEVAESKVDTMGQTDFGASPRTARLVESDVDHIGLSLLNIRIYNNQVSIRYDPDKNEKNIVDRGISFERAAEFEWSSALIVPDTRKDYGESRFQAMGFIGTRLHVLVFTPRAGRVHVISLRKANRREVKRYEAQTEP